MVKKRWENVGPLVEAFTGFQYLLVHLSSIILPRTSMQRMKRYGDNGSPYQMPLDGRKGSRTPPLKRIEVETVVTELIII